MGGLYCLDCSRLDAEGEAPVVLHGPGDAIHATSVAADFASYVLDRVKPMTQRLTDTGE